MNGFSGKNDVSTEQMTKTIDEISIDMMMLNEKNYKWNTRTICNSINKLGRVSKDINMSASDSK